MKSATAASKFWPSTSNEMNFPSYLSARSPFVLRCKSALALKGVCVFNIYSTALAVYAVFQIVGTGIGVQISKKNRFQMKSGSGFPSTDSWLRC